MSGISARAVATLLLLGFSAGLSEELGSQASLKTAASGTAIFPRAAGFLSVDLTESKIGVRSFGERIVGEQGQLREVCGIEVPRIEDRVENALEVALAAEKGKRALFSRGEFTPGVEASYSRARYFERGLVVPEACPPPGTKLDPPSLGYDVVFLKISGEWVERRTVIATETTPVQTRFGSENGLGLLGTIGWNHAWTERRVLGLALEAGGEWNSPGGGSAESVCTITTQAPDSIGQSVVVQSCKDRFRGPLGDFALARGRADFVTQVGRISEDRPSFGFLSTIAITARTTRKPMYSIALGPTLHPSDSPSRVRGALLLEVPDITDAAGKQENLRDRVGIRLYVGLPSPF